jgi:hypothetical protein
MQSISIQALANQQLQCQLGTQAVTLNIYQFQYGLFMDVLVSGNIIVSGVICQNLNRIVRDAYLGFLGDFIWVDTLGTSDPVFTGLGARWQLVYLSQSDLTALNLSG